MKPPFRACLAALTGLLLLFAACSPKPDSGEKTGSEKTTDTDGGGTPETQPEGRERPPSSGNWPPPDGYAALTFKVDDSANKTYRDKQLLWNGSFRYDEKTNIVEYASAWQPTDGPFPPLYDDGPIDQGGHEPLGAKKGDHVFGIVVFVKPDPKKDTEFEYGVINEDNNWIWEGPNGTITVKAGSPDVLDARGLNIPKHGSIDLKITLDLNKVPEAFQVDDITSPPAIFLKGTLTNWGHIQIQDRGKKGDAKEGDGILTYVQKQNLNYSPHMGLLQHKRHVQFVFQFNSVTGREYKDEDDKAIRKGVQAWADCNGDGKFTEDEKQSIVLEKDSRGAVQNTTVVVCENSKPPCTKEDCDKAECKDKPLCQSPGCQNDGDCEDTKECKKGTCVPKSGPTCTLQDCATATCKDDPICKCKDDKDCARNETCDSAKGQCIAKEKCTEDKDCPPDHTCDTGSGRCLLKPCTAQDCSEARCQQDPACNNPNQGPVIYFVTPSIGPQGGGTEVTLSGERFQQGLKVKIGGKDATDVKWLDAKRVTCKTPSSSSSGGVDVVVTNPDGQSNTYPQGFRYDNSAVPTPRVTEVSPARGDIAGGDTVSVRGRNFKAGAKVWFERNEATDVKVVSGTEITCKTPAHGTGKIAVTVKNPDGREDTLLDAFEYFEKNPKADWARIVSAKTISGSAGSPLGPIYCQVYDASFQTKNPGAAKGLKAQAGWGPFGSQPETWPAGNWTDSSFNKDVGNNDEYKTSMTIGQGGKFNFACRFSVDNGANWIYADADQPGTNNGYDPNQAGVAQVSDANALSILSVNPSTMLAKGGGKVILKGGGFQAGTTVKFGGKAGTRVKIKSLTEIEVTVPAGSVGKVDVSVTLNGKSNVLSQGFTYTGNKASVKWCNIQWPKKMPDAQNGVAGPKAGSPTPVVYGWVYKQGSTDKAGQGPGIMGHVGYGPKGTDPSKDVNWRWFPTTYNGDKAGPGNPTANDEYKGTMTPAAAGNYDYAYRFSGDGGLHFWYCNVGGNDDKTPYSTRKAASMSVQ